jgi:hypothetical protein
MQTEFHRKAHSVTAQHTVHQITQWSPEVLSAGQFMLIDEQDIMLEAGVEMGFEAEVYYYRVMMAVDMGIDTIQTLEDLAEETGEGLGEWDA